MADVKQIKVEFKRYGTLRLAANNALIWGYLLGTEAVAHLWFGGSWVIDLLVVLIGVSVCVSVGSRATGWTVSMTPAEIRLWVAAGMPSDIKAWRENRKLSSVA